MVKIETKKRYNLKIAIIKMKRKEKYESPWMERTLVELEDGFCAGSADVKNPNTEQGRINAHEVNTDFTGGDFSKTDWDTNQ